MTQGTAPIDSPPDDGAVPWLKAALFADVSGRGIAAGVGDLIDSGRLPVGTRLPTVRELAQRLGTSPAAVADAWARLRHRGVVDTRRRGGTTVIARAVPPTTQRLLDLSQATSDPALQPNLELAVAAGLRATNLHSTEKDYITPALRRAVAQSWPFAPQAWTTAAGGAEAGLSAYAAAMVGGSVFAVEDPTSPRILEALATLGARTVPVAYDAQGPCPAALERALAGGATTFLYQPRAQLPLGLSVTPERIAELAAVVAARRDIVVIEEDSLGPLAEAPPRSMGGILPDRVLHVRAYCRAYGGDLKTAVIGGGAALVGRVNTVRSHGYNITSRILQDALAFLIAAPSVDRLIAASRARYAARRTTLAAALGRRGIASDSADGLILWVPVRDESAAIVALARRGITVGAGSRCHIAAESHAPHLRIATSRLPDDPDEIEAIAATIARALLEPAQAEHD